MSPRILSLSFSQRPKRVGSFTGASKAEAASCGLRAAGCGLRAAAASKGNLILFGGVVGVVGVWKRRDGLRNEWGCMRMYEGVCVACICVRDV
jgi:hypothetical protein